MKKYVQYLGLIFCCLSCLISFNLCAQKCYQFRNYTVKDGLIHNEILSINQDNKGYLWITTGCGISRFDGAYFDNTLIPQVNKVQAFSQYVDKSPSGKLAFATFMQGVIVRDNNGGVKQYLRRKKQLGKNVVRTLKWVSDTKIITSESRNINVIENDSIYQLYDCGSNENVFITIDCDPRENVWFGGVRGLGVLFADKSSKAGPFFLPEFKNTLIVKILFSGKNKLLVGTYNGYYEVNLTAIKKGNLCYTVTRPFSELIGTKINHIYCDKQGDIWVSCVTDGVYQIENNKIKKHFTLENGLPTNSVMCAFQDTEGNYWFGTESGLCSLCSFTDFSYTHQGKPLTGISFAAKDPFNRLWLTDGTTLYTVENDKIKVDNTNEKTFGKSTLKAIDFYNNEYCFFTDKALYTAPLSEKINWKALAKKIDFVGNNINDLKCFYFEPDNTVWLGCIDGLYACSSDKVQKAQITSDKALTLRPKSILTDKYGYYWIGDYTFGLHRFKRDGVDKNGRIMLRHTQSYESLKPDSAFATAWIQDMTFDHNGNLWLSSLYTGVYKLKIDGFGVKSAVLYSTKNGLSSNDVTQVIEGKDGTLWFATPNGADRLIADKNGKEKLIHYNDKNGFGKQVYQILPNDNITYIACEEGFFGVDNQLDKYFSNKPLAVVISRVSVMGKPDTAAMAVSAKPYVLPYDQNFISFEFGAVRLKDNEGIDYQYKLEGIDPEWSEYSTRRYAAYNSLASGKYVFKVRAKMVNNEENGTVTEYEFRIKPPFYRTWWFVSLLIFLIISVIYTIYIQRIKNLIKMERLRVKIASDLHDDIGSTLSSISIMSEIAQSQMDKSTQSGELIREIGTNAHLMLENMDDIIWSVKPSNDKFYNLDVRIREYAIPLFESKNIQFQFVVPEELNNFPLSMEMRRNLFLIAKEAINNLVKYSQCTQADIIFSHIHSALEMKISDNGCGFDISQNMRRNGLRNMKQRAEQIGGEIEILSEKLKGTQILLLVKII